MNGREKSLKPYLELKIDDSDQQEVRKILSRYPGMLNIKKGTSGADPWVIALAMKFQNGVVVTEEKSTGNLQHPRIPDVCKVSNIECVTIAGVVKKENWIFGYMGTKSNPVLDLKSKICYTPKNKKYMESETHEYTRISQSGSLTPTFFRV